jgi:TonB family protein
LSKTTVSTNFDFRTSVWPNVTRKADMRYLLTAVLSLMAARLVIAESATNAALISTVPGPQNKTRNVECRKCPVPPYKYEWRKARLEGRVILTLNVDTYGLVEAISIRKSSGFAQLDDGALEVVKTWQFVPKRVNGVPVSTALDVPIDFSLEPEKYVCRSCPPPRLPPDSLKRGQQAKVVLRVFFNAAGAVKSVEVKTSSGSRPIDDAAIHAVQTWQVQPKLADGVAVEFKSEIPLLFTGKDR